jgi:hypothetical protein
MIFSPGPPGENRLKMPWVTGDPATERRVVDGSGHRARVLRIVEEAVDVVDRDLAVDRQFGRGRAGRAGLRIGLASATSPDIVSWKVNPLMRAP